MGWGLILGSEWARMMVVNTQRALSPRLGTLPVLTYLILVTAKVIGKPLFSSLSSPLVYKQGS